MSLVVDLQTGLPKFNNTPWSQVSGSIDAGSTKVIDSIPLVEFDSMKYEMSFKGLTQDDVRSLTMRVQQLSGALKDTVFSRTGTMNIDLEARINGSNFELEANNTQAFAVDYCLTVLTT